ncbi:uncharacterized protein LOC122391061 [Amphibalanus amphitrite]|uniref:uncharacterized protein LOC122391061 n=1 Tax=Amphibalanus amphitrite TaxID=1232801 RepID=UPI001C914A22|nr:uncharacterized protein LOC122391061 [Amphibalanus amphitrite]XP_043240534.1 uncharacterized protein LOC122391061 [Amphibalanus amphitrite]
MCGDRSDYLTQTSQGVSRTSDSERQSVLRCGDASIESSDADAPCDSVRFPGEFVALCAGRARDWYHPSFHQFSVLQRAVRDLSAAAEETVRREVPPEDRPALTRLEPLADGALSLRPPTLRRPRREAELQQLVVALDGACPLVAGGSCGSHVTPSALSAARHLGPHADRVARAASSDVGSAATGDAPEDALVTAASPDRDGHGDSSERSLPHQVSEWSCVPVGGWLRSLGLAQYADAFVARSVDGARLLGLTEQAMEDEPDVGLDVATSKPACWVSASRHSPADLSASWTASVPHS